MIASITTKYRGPTDRTGSRVVAVARLKRDGSTVRITRPWNHAEGVEENHRRAAFAALDRAGVPANNYVLDGFNHDGVGTWVAQGGDANRLLRIAEAKLADAREAYQRGETEDLREKYLDAIREDVDQCDAILSFLKSNL